MKPSGTREARWPRHALRHRLLFAVAGAGALAALFAVSDGPRSADGLEECVDYAAAVRRCFGEQTKARAPRAPKTSEDRAAARKRCLADKERIERACR